MARGFFIYPINLETVYLMIGIITNTQIFSIDILLTYMREILIMIYQAIKDAAIYFGSMFGMVILKIDEVVIAISGILGAALIIINIVNGYRKLRDYKKPVEKVEKIIIREKVVENDKTVLKTREEEAKRKRQLEANKPKERVIISKRG